LRVHLYSILPMIHECTANYSTRIGNPWKPTSQIVKANKVLKDMFNSLDSDSPLKKFLRDHCSHLLDLDFNDPTVVTGSSATTLTSHSVKGGKGKGHPAKSFGLVGVYVFQCSTTFFPSFAGEKKSTIYWFRNWALYSI
jgi:hypothetical protein